MPKVRFKPETMDAVQFMGDVSEIVKVFPEAKDWYNNGKTIEIPVSFRNEGRVCVAYKTDWILKRPAGYFEIIPHDMFYWRFEVI